MSKFEVHLYPVVDGADPKMTVVEAEFFTESDSGFIFYIFDTLQDDTVMVHYFPREVVFFIAKV